MNAWKKASPDISDVASLVCPKPMLLYNGLEDVSRAFDIVFLQQSLDDAPFTFRHGSRFVVLFLLARHNQGLL